MKKVKTIFGMMSMLFALLMITVLVTENYSNYRFLIGSVSGDILNVGFGVCAAVCLLVSAIAAIISKSEKHIVFNSVIRFLCICFICFFAYFLSTFISTGNYYEFSSPDGEHTVVAEEWSFLLGGGVNFYERINPVFVKYKENFSTDDGFRAISWGDYSVEWEENVMSITLQNGNNIYKTVNIVV